MNFCKKCGEKLENDTVLKSAHSGSYIDELTKLKTLALKVASLR